MLGRQLLKCVPVLASRSYTTPASAAAYATPPSNGFSFGFTDEQKELQATAQKFAREKIMPKAAFYDETMEFPWEIINEAHANGFMNVTVPTKYGGLGLDQVSTAILYENLCYGCSGISLPVIINEVALTPLLIAGSEELKREYIGRLIEKPLVASFAATEPIAGSDVAGTKTYSVKDGGDYIINGSKMWITNGGPADWFFVLTRSDRDPKTPASKAFTAFIVDGSTPGVIRGKKEAMMGQRASWTCGITFEDVRVSASNMVGRPGEGFIIAMKTFDETRPMVAAVANGIAARCLDESSNYALERKAFGKSIAENQGVSFMLADMAINLELSRLITYRCAYDLMMGHSGSYFSSIAKCFAADTANQAAANAVQIFGGNGYCREYPVEKLMRDAKILQIYEGTSQIQRVVISRRLLNRAKETGSASATY